MIYPAIGAEKYINSFAALKLLNGYPDGNFKPDNVITRAEVIAVLNRITQNDNSRRCRLL